MNENKKTGVPYYPPLYKIKENSSLKSQQIEELMEEISAFVMDSDSEQEARKKTGLDLLARSLKRRVFRKNSVFGGLEDLELLEVDIRPFFLEELKRVSFAVVVSYPPSTSTIQTLDNATTATNVIGWIHDNNVDNVCSVVIVNEETFRL